MKNAIAAHLADEHFVIRVDGRVKSHHRRFLDALREGLQLRDQFPQHDVKRAAKEVQDIAHPEIPGRVVFVEWIMELGQVQADRHLQPSI